MRSVFEADIACAGWNPSDLHIVDVALRQYAERQQGVDRLEAKQLSRFVAEQTAFRCDEGRVG